MEEYLQLLFLIETKQSGKSDEIYIKEILGHYFEINRKSLRLEFVYLNGKFNYTKKEKAVKAKTKLWEKQTNGRTEVILILDKDNFCLKRSDLDFVNDVTAFCKNKKYHLVWFVSDIEEVMVGERISQSKKTKVAVEFKRKKSIETFQCQKLKNSNPCSKKTSNIFVVLRKMLNTRE